ncbi:MAG: PQQ-dependent dehydrogenase, methanol/ethanol family [Myxococcota bacterium]
MTLRLGIARALALGMLLGAPVRSLGAELEGAGRIDSARLRAASREPGSWLAHGRTWSEQRFSPLREIDASNVSRLGLAWAYETGTLRGLEATPIVVDGVMYATGSWSIVFALDAATGRELWRYDPHVPGEAGRKACCDVVNRGVAVWKGRVFEGTLDGRLIALDAATGKLLWQVQTVDPSRAYTITGAPRVVGDRVIIGNGGAEFGVRGYFGAYDVETGELRWRFYVVPAGPDGPFEQPELERAAGTWSRDSLWESGLGGTAWDSFAYDPELDLLYVGTGNASVYERERRSPGGGDNLFLATILAVRPETGELVWYYQTTPGESWDYTATQHMILADLQIAGRLRRVLMQAPKNGFFYVLDRASGDLISAAPYVPTNWASRIDLETGRPVETGKASWHDRRAFVTPGPRGGHNWHPMSYSPETGLVYVPTISSVHPFIPDPDFHYAEGRFNTAEDYTELAELASGPPFRFCSPTQLLAWDPVHQREAWRVDHESALPAGVLSTAGGLVFQGTAEQLVAYDARTGDELWRGPTGVGVIAPPIAYRLGDEEYIAVLAGVGGTAGMHYTETRYENRGRVLAFKLGGAATLPPAPPRRRRSVDVPRISLDPERIGRGRELYSVHCARCHNFGA